MSGDEFYDDDVTSGVGFRPGHSHGLDPATGEWRPFPFDDALVEQADATLQLVTDAVQDTLREDLGHGWTLMELARMLHIIDPDKRWRAIAEKLTHPSHPPIRGARAVRRIAMRPRASSPTWRASGGTDD